MDGWDGYEPSSPKVIPMVKSEIRGIFVEETIESLVCQPAGRRENDFATSIKSAYEPTAFTLVRTEADLVQSRKHPAAPT
mgnify:CR=1 FL=1